MGSSIAILFLVARGRGKTVLHGLIGDGYGGSIGSDRGHAYLGLPAERHQLCWADLIRNFLALSERRGMVAVWATGWLVLSTLVFRLWQLHQGGRDRPRPIAGRPPTDSGQYARAAHAGSRRWDAGTAISHELLEHWEALWTFVRVAGVEPNSAAERASPGRLVAQRLF